MSLLTPTTVSKTGLSDFAASLTAADVAGDSVMSAGGLLVVMANGDASPHTLTVSAPSATSKTPTLGSLAVSDITLVVAAGDTGFVTIPAGYSNGSVDFEWTYDDVTSVTIGVFSLSP